MFTLMPHRGERKAGYPLLMQGTTPFDLLRREFVPLFDRAFAGWDVPFQPPWEAAKPWGLDVDEKEQEYVVRAEMPGFEASEIEVRLTGDLLTLRAEHKQVPEAKAEKPVERRYGRLERALTLPAGIVPDKVEAQYRNGVLEVHVPKVPEVQPRRIEVKA